MRDIVLPGNLTQMYQPPSLHVKVSISANKGSIFVQSVGARQDGDKRRSIARDTFVVCFVLFYIRCREHSTRRHPGAQLLQYHSMHATDTK